MIDQGHGGAELERAAVVVLYDKATGKIVHVHYAIADTGSELGGPEILEREALAHATGHTGHRPKSHVDVQRLACLHGDARTLRMDGSRRYKVDPAKRVLVEVDN